MKNNEFIKKYGIQNLYSIMESVRANLAALYYGKKFLNIKLIIEKNKLNFISTESF